MILVPTPSYYNCHPLIWNHVLLLDGRLPPVVEDCALVVYPPPPAAAAMVDRDSVHYDVVANGPFFNYYDGC